MAPQFTTAQHTNTNNFPAAYINHGGGPLPLLGRQPAVVEALKSVSDSMPRPEAIVIISAHFESKATTILTNPSPPMLYDYHGFPSESYQLKYPAPTAMSILPQIRALLTGANIPYRENTNRGYDHGIFVPLSIMYPDVNIPILAISQPESMSPSECIRLGKALQPLRKQNVLILGSGASFHNFNAFFRSKDENDLALVDAQQSETWDKWLNNTICECDERERNELLEKWQTAPFARFAHPREEHLSPLFVIAGAAGEDRGVNMQSESMRLFRLKVSQFVFGL